MTSIKKTAPKPPGTTTQRPNVSSCGPVPKAPPSASCGGWVSKSTRAKAEKSDVSLSCGGWKSTGGSVMGCGGWKTKGPSVSGCGIGVNNNKDRFPSGC